MKPLETAEKHLEAIGFRKNQHRLNAIQLGFVLENFVNIVLTCISVCHVIDTPEMFMICVLMFVIITLVFVSRVSTVYKTKNLFVFIERYKEMIIQSKKEINKNIGCMARLIENMVSGNKYGASGEIEKTHQFVEKCCKTLHFAMVQFGVPAFILPRAFVSYFLYFITDANRDAFVLPIPTW